MTTLAETSGKKGSRSLLRRIIKHKVFYFMLIPGLVYVIMFHYFPIGNLVIAFQDFKLFKGISGSQWVWFDNFIELFSSRTFYQLFRNTLIISFASLLVGYPAAIILALLINEVDNVFIKRYVQTVVYLPHFMSWVVVAAMASTMLSLDDGVINVLIKTLGGKQQFFLGSTKLFRAVLVIVYVWKESGWNAIIYLAALTSVPQDLYEAAAIDGANKLQRLWFISLPSILPTITITLLLRIGRILNMGFEQIMAMYSPAVYEVADVIDTYVYRVGLVNQNFSFSAAVGLFKSVVSLIMVLGANWLANFFEQESLF